MKKKRLKRYTKRLECEFSGAGRTYKGFVSNVSDRGLFIRTNRSFREDSRVGVKIYLPDEGISSVRGVVRHAMNSLDTRLVRNGMGIELTEMDENFLRLVRKAKGVRETEEITEKPENRGPGRKPEKVVVLCLVCGVNNAVPRDKLASGPKCDACNSTLVPM